MHTHGYCRTRHSTCKFARTSLRIFEAGSRTEVGFPTTTAEPHRSEGTRQSDEQDRKADRWVHPTGHLHTRVPRCPRTRTYKHKSRTSDLGGPQTPRARPPTQPETGFCRWVRTEGPSETTKLQVKLHKMIRRSSYER